MSRSHHQKSCGRGCWVCGDAGENRRNRESSWQKADDRELENDSLAPVDERKLYDQGPEQDSLAPVPEQDSRRRGGWGGW